MEWKLGPHACARLVSGKGLDDGENLIFGDGRGLKRHSLWFLPNCRAGLGAHDCTQPHLVPAKQSG